MDVDFATSLYRKDVACSEGGNESEEQLTGCYSLSTALCIVQE